MMKANVIEDEKMNSVTGGVGETAQTTGYVTVKALQNTCLSPNCKCSVIDCIQIDAKTYRQECTECGNLWYVEL